jgi:serine/threonine-protein kinase
MPAQVVLEVVQGKLKGKTYRFDKHAVCLVGRAEDCQIRLPSDADHRTVSRHHCMLDVDPPTLRVQDFGSRNGTYLNGTMIGQRAEAPGAEDPGLGHFPERDLQDGDELRVGQTVFRVRILRPPTCSLCGDELPAETDTAQETGGALCAACREVLGGPCPTPTVPACARCGRTVTLPAGTPRRESLICLACRQDPRRLVEDLLEQANTGRRDLDPIKNYTLLDELGRREEGAVYLARNTETGDRVALKVMFPRGASDGRTRLRFLREAQNTMALRHPNLVQLRDAGWSNGLFFFTLEYCEGGTVTGLLRQRGGKLTLDEAAPLVLQALDGLEYAHNAEVPFVPHAEGDWSPGRGLVHRDVKPANIFLSGSGTSTVAKIGDFGLAKAFDKAGLSGQTWSGLLSGTPFFMPRQQVLSYKYARPEVDVWAMAATLYYMLTGVPARDFTRGNGWMEVVLESAAVPILQRLPSLPARVAELIDDALLDRPEIPFKTAADFKHALLTVL